LRKRRSENSPGSLGGGWFGGREKGRQGQGQSKTSGKEFVIGNTRSHADEKEKILWHWGTTPNNEVLLKAEEKRGLYIPGSLGLNLGEGRRCGEKGGGLLTQV